jgi:hypothetical protein
VWPEFTARQSYDGSAPFADVLPLRGWTAKFDSYDQYRDYCYYVVTTYDGDRAAAEFMVQVHAPLDGPELENELRKSIATVAADGKTNTSWSR